MKSFIFFELSVLVIFLVTLWHSARRKTYYKTELWTALFYALLFEELDMKFFKTYHYGDGYSLLIANVPLVIALAWAIIIYSSMHISDCYPISEPVKPFFDALLAVLIDLSVDAIAIRLGYWQWNIPLNEGWFGVPAGNLYAWMFVVFFFSLFCRVIRTLCGMNKNYLFLSVFVPFLSYAGLFISIVLAGTVNTLFGFNENRKLFTFFAIVLFFSAVFFIDFLKKKKEIPAAIHPVVYFIRLCLHAFFLIELFTSGLFLAIPILLAVSLGSLALETMIHKQIKL